MSDTLPSNQDILDKLLGREPSILDDILDVNRDGTVDSADLVRLITASGLAGD